MEHNQNNNKKPNDEKKKPGIFVTLLITVGIVLIISLIYNAVTASQYTQTTYSDFIKAMESENLAEVELRSDRIVYMTKTEAAKDKNEQKACYTGLPSGGNTMDLAKELNAMGVKVNREIVEDNSFIMTILSYVLMFGLLFGFMSLITRRMGGDGMMGSVGGNKAKMYMEKQTGVTFKDVAGQDEAKESLQEIID